MLNGVTISGKVRFWAIDRGTPTWSILRLGSGVITVRAEKSTLLPMRFPRIRPSLPFKRALIAFRGLPLFCIALQKKYAHKCRHNNLSTNTFYLLFTSVKDYKVHKETYFSRDEFYTTILYLGRPGMSLSTRVATWNCNILIFSASTWAAAPACSFRTSSLLAFRISDNLWVRSSCRDITIVIQKATWIVKLTRLSQITEKIWCCW